MLTLADLQYLRRLVQWDAWGAEAPPCHAARVGVKLTAMTRTRRTRRPVEPPITTGCGMAELTWIPTPKGGMTVAATKSKAAPKKPSKPVGKKVAKKR